jgi:NADPH:quinone reductase-like Zn-dependent oxidoreductase
LGADVVIDYGREDFTKSGLQYDLVLDLVGNRSLRDLRRVLKPSGTIVLSGGGVSGQRCAACVGIVLARECRDCHPSDGTAPENQHHA